MDNEQALNEYRERTNHGHVFVGGDQDIFRAGLLATSLSGYAKTGMRPTRGVGPTQMLKLATQYTGQKYKRGDYEKAAADLMAHVRFLQTHPNTDKPLPRFP